MLPPDPTFDLDRRLPSRWPADAAPFAPLLKILRDEIREEYGAAFAAQHVTEKFVIAALKAKALDLLARQMTEIDGRAYAIAVVRLINALTIEDEDP